MNSHRRQDPSRALLPRGWALAGLALLAALGWPGGLAAQDLEPRRWTHLPVGMNVASLTYAYTDGDLSLDPVLRIEDATVETHTFVAGFVRAFECFGRTGRLDLIAPYQTSEWEGQLDGMPASTRRQGPADPWVRFSVDLLGAPALKGKAYQEYRAARPVHTVAGAAIGLSLPLGEYQEDKLLNLGQNRFTIRPQVGAVHQRGLWAYELTTSASFYTDNDEFLGDMERAQDPAYTLQAHTIRSFPNAWWVSMSGGYSWGGASEIDGVSKDDERGDLLYALSFGLPVTRTQGLKLVYFRSDTQEDVGGDTDSVFVSWSMRF